MKVADRDLSPGRPRKRRRTDAELQALAIALGADWILGEPVQAWINRHEGELSRLVEEGWSWEDIGKAMHLAGISYSTGQQISAPTLRLKVHLARKREKQRLGAAKATSWQNEASSPQQVTPAPVPPVFTLRGASTRPETVSTHAKATVETSDEAELTFPLVTLKTGQQPLKPQPPLPHPQPQEFPAAKISDEDILHRVFGKP